MMQFDLAAFLVSAALVTGSIWVLDKWVLAPRRALVRPTGQAGEQVTGKDILPWYVDFSRSFFPVILIVLVLRSFIVEPFRIPSDSMLPTLRAGDFILVNKFAFGVRLPVVNAKIIDSGSPQRGDVAVFRYPEDPSVDYIKRVVGLPGDWLEYRNKQLYINGEPVPQSAPPPDSQSALDGYETRLEKLGNVSHLIQLREGQNGISFKRQVPQGHYFAMGDNRDNSYDSRFWGFLPEKNLIGKAFMIWLNKDCIIFQGHCNRIGRSIQ